MIRYEVNLEIDENIYNEFYLWLKEEHIAEVLQFKGFLNANIYEENNATQKRNLVVVYDLDDMENLSNYFTEHAPVMRSKGISKFGTQFKASRRILELKQVFNNEFE